MPKAIVITEQPASASVPVGYSLTMRCRATACTSPQYQWFYQCQSACCQIVGATEPDLLITARETRLYICRINDLHKNVTFSNWVRVEVHQHIAKGLLPELWQGEPVVVLNPTAPEVKVGKPLQLQCAALGVPAPHYQWYHNGTPMKHQKKKKLLINSAKLSDSGTYLCCAANGQGEHWTDALEIHVGTCLADPFFATDKVALLVGNNHYWNHPHLMAPITDVFELSLLLKRLGFRVVSLLDLNKAEMLIAVNQFLQLLGKGVYAVFYYAGHGYEHFGRNYMVPIDAPQPYAPENCISVQRILQKMQQRRTALNLILLDTCRKWYNPQCALSQVQPLEPWGNTVYGYATSEDAEAYEVQDGEFSSGIFVKYLKKHILQEKKVTHVLEDVLEDIGRDPLVTGKQVMEIKHTLKEARALTDPICTTGPTAELWGHNHELLKETLTFPCGIQVELRFQVVFSNVMHVSAKLQAPPPHVTDIRLLLCRPAEVRELAMLPDCQSDRVVSLLVSLYEQEELDCVLRLCGLQKIQTDVLLQLDLHYTQLGTKQRACESLQKILQKSLLAKLFSQKSSANPSCMAGQKAAATMGPKDAPAVNAAHEGPSSLRAEPRHSWQCSRQSNICSEPEENDESDLSSLCSALQRAGPGQDCP
ncbi:mucosa-associated lymphoid tissue lymphoma translocation protein 1-like isoform X1 [Trachemys scripta elegans]|uniref:mucosa-associated lymphoid tissue lymphoma translocation protein 1-like isoform X1 n=1 Tax=Trachemys scripta elegans TaxID=31138 RepID=UPI0015548FF7|nr:mucosa-associated lymphoid tissue lymphoma translocation protein 1-like isoform X1 [Trachemys scripta elegans]XP_034640186.1 mucosa-associated lymphoid tissue lymphoma translocation protein 1-like isoform X1 [Trachemys scripta elegans]XP_053896945.1 mucosa-associated lymphoid tissue lymphoma translocation protein 1-like isoform X1 [Malaclemys terrapin pileata]XP_053896947.1 mucosa-associated lymphoid tissue lymphoma translocation protein 1-like isoform X1 [Malaclemys terrapin pileata]XP_0538